MLQILLHKEVVFVTDATKQQSKANNTLKNEILKK